jgi:competence protein ComEC
VDRIAFTRRPALFVFICFGVGIFLERYVFNVFSLKHTTLLSDLQSGILIGVACLVFGVYALLLLRKWHFASCSFLIAASVDTSLLRDPLAIISRTKAEDVTLYGSITSDSVLQKASTLVQCDSFQCENSTIRATELVAVEFPFRTPHDTASRLRGERVELRGTLQPLAEARNPYEYPADEHLFARYGVTARFIVKNRYDVLDRGTSVGSFTDNIARVCSKIRGIAARAIATAISDSLARGFVEAVVIGERSDLPNATRDDFTNAGVSHILAVSGFNVAIIAVLITQLLRFVGLRKRTLKIVLTMLGVLVYSAVVGFEPSVVRALIMVEVYLLARLIERRADPVNVIASAALITLLVRPFDLLDGGFQLSYAAVFGLAIFYPEIKRLWKIENMKGRWIFIRKPLTEAFAVSLAATLATLPVTVWHFHRVSVVGSLANLPIIPLASVITSLGFLLIPLTSISTAVGQLYGDGVAALSRVLLWLTHLSASVPRASIAVERPSLMILAAIVVGMLYVLRSNGWKHFVGRSTIAVGAVIMLLFFIPFADPIVSSSNRLTLLAYDVGQGDCFLLKSPSGHSYFIDLGGISLSNVTRAERAVLPSLEAEGVSTIDAAFLTHMHRDHYGGASTLATRPGISNYYWSGERVTDPLAHELDRTIMREHSKVVRISAGDRIALESDLIIYAMHPPKILVDTRGPARGARLNNGSLVLKVVYKNSSALFLGDIEAIDEAMLVRNYGTILKSEIVKVAHHGSAGSVMNEFVKDVAPMYAIISVGENNRYGHPSAYALNVWGHSGAKILRTDREGAIMLRSDGEHFRVVDWR